MSSIFWKKKLKYFPVQDNAGKAHFYAVYKVNRKEKRKEEKRYFEKKTEKKEKAKGFLKAFGFFFCPWNFKNTVIWKKIEMRNGKTYCKYPPLGNSRAPQPYSAQTITSHNHSIRSWGKLS